MDVTIKQLKVFVATARLKKLSEAAESLFISQSAASQSLKELENILGHQLFTRIKRELVLNEYGLQLLAKAQQILSLQQQIQSHDRQLVQTLHLVASVTIGCYLLPKLIAQYQQLNPLVKISLHIDNSEYVINQLAQGQAHLGFVERPVSHDSLMIEPWKKDNLVVFCSPDYRCFEQDKDALTINELAQQNWILREHGSGTREVFIQAMQKHGLAVQTAFDFSRQEAIKQAVKANLGIGVLSQLSIVEEIQKDQVKVIHTPLDLTRQFSIVSSKHYQYEPTITNFYHFIQSQ